MQVVEGSVMPGVLLDWQVVIPTALFLFLKSLKREFFNLEV